MVWLKLSQFLLLSILNVKQGNKNIIKRNEEKNKKVMYLIGDKNSVVDQIIARVTNLFGMSDE